MKPAAVSEARLLTELRSLRSHPPVALDEEAADELERRDLVLVTGDTRDGLKLYTLTTDGEKLLAAAEEQR